MDRSHRNKENKSKSKPIQSYFKVSKRLFEPNLLDYTSPTCDFIQQSSPSLPDDESPYLYEIRKKQTSTKVLVETTSTFSNNALGETPLKRTSCSAKQRICLSSNIMELSYEVTMESPGSTAVKELVEKAMDTQEQETLSGDFSQKCILPVVRGKHPELPTITADTAAWLLISEHKYDITIIDCRYPYEYQAGHIKNAINLFSKEYVEEDFFNLAFTKKKVKSEKLFIFYCEFSSERAPNMMRYVRNRDRKLNEGLYPFVYYPEMYLIDGGYKSFFASFKNLCEPQDYKPMLDKENTSDFVYYKSLCKKWNFKLQKDEQM